MNKILFGAAVLAGIGCAAIGVPVDFVLFGVTLAAVALFHHHTLQVALGRSPLDRQSGLRRCSSASRSR